MLVAFVAFVAGVAAVVAATAAWITHIVNAFQHEAWGLLIGGAIFFPIAIVNGIGIWFGWW